MGDTTTTFDVLDVPDTSHESAEQARIRAEARKALRLALWRALPVAEEQVLAVQFGLYTGLPRSDRDTARYLGMTLAELLRLRSMAYARLRLIPELRELLYTICQDQTQRQMGQSRANEGAE